LIDLLDAAVVVVVVVVVVVGAAHDIETSSL